MQSAKTVKGMRSCQRQFTNASHVPLLTLARRNMTPSISNINLCCFFNSQIRKFLFTIVYHSTPLLSVHQLKKKMLVFLNLCYAFSKCEAPKLKKNKNNSSYLFKTLSLKMSFKCAVFFTFLF